MFIEIVIFQAYVIVSTVNARTKNANRLAIHTTAIASRVLSGMRIENVRVIIGFDV